MLSSVKIGSKVGQASILAQLALRRLSIADENTLITGEVDDYWDICIREFQRSASLTKDGWIGPRTWSVLLKRIEEMDLLCLFIHCTAGNMYNTAAQVKHFHMSPNGRNWSRPGYHYIIELMQVARIWEADMNADVEGIEKVWGILGALNRRGHHICYTGGVDQVTFKKVEDTRTTFQKNAMAGIVLEYLESHPDLLIVPHRALANKGCPSFDVPEWCRSIDIEEKNIHHWGQTLVLD